MAPDPQLSSTPNIPKSMLAKVHHLNQPAKLEAALKEDQALVDCLPCRVIGTVTLFHLFHSFHLLHSQTVADHPAGASAFIGLGTYTFFSGHAQLRQQEALILKSGSRFGMRIRRGGITGIATVLLGMGLYRLVN